MTLTILVCPVTGCGAQITPTPPYDGRPPYYVTRFAAAYSAGIAHGRRAHHDGIGYSPSPLTLRLAMALGKRFAGWPAKSLEVRS